MLSDSDSEQVPMGSNNSQEQGHPGDTSSSSQSQMTQVSGHQITFGSVLQNRKFSQLLTAKASVQNPETTEIKNVAVFFDTGSQRTFMSHTLASELLLSSCGPEPLSLKTFASEQPQHVDSYVVCFNLVTNNGTSVAMQANVLPRLTGSLRRSPLQGEDMEFLKKYSPNYLADTIPKEAEEISPELVIGNDYFWDLVDPVKIKLPSSLYLIGSKLGLLLGGNQYGEFCGKTKAKPSSEEVCSVSASTLQRVSSPKSVKP
ncbi:MAG: hypothetical protein GY696_39970, partial [Gammaproteobacteria bacterium]|nr:hypothetical protein [Gammaproteobacteria bacterium]